MSGRGNARGRGGRGGTQVYGGNQATSIRNRLGPKAAPFSKYGGINKPSANNLTSSKKFKYQRPQSAITAAVAPAPQEGRIKGLIRRFLNSYYEIFDKPGRANLESQYSADAFFSFSATYESPAGSGRNLLKITDPSQRVQLLLHNKTTIAQNLRLFSPTEHMVNLLSYDVPYYIVNPMSVTNMQVVVTGVFKDTSETTNPLRAFTRVFLLKQVSNDQHGEPVYEIFNDIFMLQPPTPDQIKKYHHDFQIVKRLSAANQNNAQERTKNSILQSVMSKTKMNRDGSKQLLEENQWDEEKAMQTFNQLSATNTIPQAFFLGE